MVAKTSFLKDFWQIIKSNITLNCQSISYFILCKALLNLNNFLSHTYFIVLTNKTMSPSTSKTSPADP
jgi:hypothetical protein